MKQTMSLAGMFGRRLRIFLLAGAIAGAMLGLAIVAGSQAANAQSGSLVYGLTDGGELIGFDPANPAQVESRVAVGGDASGDTILGMDFRPATDELYAIGASSTVYTIDPASGAASAVGTTDPAVEGSIIGFDFNPTADAIRVVTDAGQNLRLTDLDAELGTTVDGELAFDEGDENAGGTPAVVGAGYTNNVPDADETMLFDIDLSTGNLLQQDANPGVLTTIGSLGVEFTGNVGFDIAAPNDDAYAVLQPGEGLPSSLYEVDLDSGAATEIGAIGEGEVIGGFAIPTGDMSSMDTSGMGTQMDEVPNTGGFPAGILLGGAALALAGLSLFAIRRRSS